MSFLATRVQRDRIIVTLMNVFTHPSSLRRKRWGIHPPVIQNLWTWCSDAHKMEHPIEWDIVLIPWKQRGRLIFTLSALTGTH